MKTSNKKFQIEEKEGIDDFCIKCLYCSKMFESVHSRDYHMYSCYSTSVDLKKPNMFPCEQCKASYMSIGRLRQHIRHDCGRNHMCKYCQRSFSESSSLKRHLRAGICRQSYLQF